jgi:anti-sigma-K factor RskA
MTDFLQDQAALYALGLLDPEEARALEQLIPSDPALATLVRDLQNTLAQTTYSKTTVIHQAIHPNPHACTQPHKTLIPQSIFHPVYSTLNTLSNHINYV